MASEVVLGGRTVAIRRPRVQADGQEVPLPTFRTMADEDPLNRRVVEQMLVGVATRQYARSLESIPAPVVSRGTSKSAVSRRFVAKTAAQLAAWRSTTFDALDVVALLIDGVQIAEHCIVVALGIDHTGQKHALGLWDGSTENAAVCQSLLADLQSRGLRTDRSLLVILDGSKALHKAVTQTFGPAALIHRCHVHKLRNILEHLPESQRPWVRAIVARAYTAEVPTARRLLQDLARRLDDRYPSAAASVREGLEDTLTILSLGLSDRLRHSLATTNAIESLISRTRHVKRNVKRWRGGQMVLRWAAAAVLEAAFGSSNQDAVEQSSLGPVRLCPPREGLSGARSPSRAPICRRVIAPTAAGAVPPPLHEHRHRASCRAEAPRAKGRPRRRSDLATSQRPPLQPCRHS